MMHAPEVVSVAWIVPKALLLLKLSPVHSSSTGGVFGSTDSRVLTHFSCFRTFVSTYRDGTVDQTQPMFGKKTVR